MLALVALGLTAFLLCLVLTPVCRDAFIRADILDRPDGERKLHSQSVPRMGGIPIVVSYATALGLVYFLAPNGARIYIQHGALMRALLPATLLVFLTGLADDIFSLKPLQKLAGQVAAAVIAVTMGAHLTLIHHSTWLAYVLSVVWLIGCTNAVNLIDGMDGLATGVGLLATGTTLVVALFTGNMGLAMATIPLAGCLFAFLRYNFSPASIFLGDCGSLTIGFILGCFGLIWSQHTGTLLGMAAPLMALALPLIDVGLAIGRRFLRRAPIMKADRSHIHHMVLALGFTPRGAALILYAVCGVFASLALLASFTHPRLLGLVILLFCLVALVGISRLRYPEVAALLRTVSHNVLRRAVEEEIYLGELSRDLIDSKGPEDCWKVVRAACTRFRFASATMYLDDQLFEEDFCPSHVASPWRVQLSLGKRGQLILTRSTIAETPRFAMVVLHHIQETIALEASVAQSAPESSSLTSAA